jgi:hypothetical protein
MYMSGGNQSVKVVLRNPLDKSDQVDYTINTNDSQLSQDWVDALRILLQSNRAIEKNFCFLGFPQSTRNLTYLCNELNTSIHRINTFNRTKIWQQAGLEPYIIEEYYTPDVIRFGDEYTVNAVDDDIDTPISDLGLHLKKGTMNVLHNHFERLQGTVWSLSEYYKLADNETKYAIRQLNNICHEIENLVLSQRKKILQPQWVRPSQITTFLQAPRYDLIDEHRQGFSTNGYNRVLGGVYMHWTQIGKTYFEVWRDEGAPDLTDTVCEAITDLRYYSGEFDVEWGQDVVYGVHDQQWHTEKLDEFYAWLAKNGKDRTDTRLSLGYLPLGQVDLYKSFGTTDQYAIWEILGRHLDIYRIEVNGVSNTFDYCWTDLDYKYRQIETMKAGYDHSSRG